MAQVVKKMSDLTALGELPADGDQFLVRDISEADGDRSKIVTYADLSIATQTEVDAKGDTTSLESKYKSDPESISPSLSAAYEQLRAPELSENMVCHLRCGKPNVEGVGHHRLYDYSGNSNHGWMFDDKYSSLFVPASNPSAVVTDAASIQNIFAAGGSAVCVWIMPYSDGDGNVGRCVNKRAASGEGWEISVSAEVDGFMKISFGVRWSTGPVTATWVTDDAVIPANMPTRVWVLYDGSSTANDPTIYINNVAYTVASGLTESFTPAGTIVDDTGADLRIGDRADGTKEWDGFIWDVGMWIGSQPTAQDIADDFLNGNISDSFFDIRYKMDESSGNYVNSGSGTLGDSTNSNISFVQHRISYDAEFTSGNVGKGFVIEPDTKHVRISNFNEVNTALDQQAFSVLFTAKIDAYTDGDTILSHSNPGEEGKGWEVHAVTGNKLEVVLNDLGTGSGDEKQFSTTSTFTLGQEFTFGFSWRRDTLSLFMDGVEDATPTKTLDDVMSVVFQTISPIVLGGYLLNDVLTDVVDCTIYDFRIFNIDILEVLK